jgi:hypothetical protein
LRIRAGRGTATGEPGRVAVNQPDGIVLTRNRDLVGRRYQVWIRRGFLLVFAAVPVVALFNVFGQRPDTTIARSPAASLKLYAPAHLRGGLLFSARFHVKARQELRDAILVLDSGWAEGMAINTIEPSPVGEASRDGKLSFDLGHVPAGQSYILFMQFQVNPTNVGYRSQDVELFDGKTRLLTIHRAVTIYP